MVFHTQFFTYSLICCSAAALGETLQKSSAVLDFAGSQSYGSGARSE
jgi:hypothetical protein